jgi:hypothetical protein
MWKTRCVLQVIRIVGLGLEKSQSYTGPTRDENRAFHKTCLGTIHTHKNYLYCFLRESQIQAASLDCEIPLELRSSQGMTGRATEKQYLSVVTESNDLTAHSKL